MADKLLDDPRLSRRLLGLVASREFLWFLGHVLTVVGGVLSLLELSRDGDRRYLSLSYMGAILSYGIIYSEILSLLQNKTLKTITSKLLSDENGVCLLQVTYNLVAMRLPGKDPKFTKLIILVCLVPFLIFASINIVTYIRTRLAVVIFTKNSNITKKLDTIILSLTKAYQPKLLAFSAWFEALVVLPTIIFSGLSFRVSFITAFIYLRVFALRYASSFYLATVYMKIRRALDSLLTGKYSPKFVSAPYSKARDFSISFFSPTPVNNTCRR